MIYDIVISDQAEIDLRGIFEYIAFELQAPENASGQLDRLEACIMDLDHICHIEGKHQEGDSYYRIYFAL